MQHPPDAVQLDNLTQLDDTLGKLGTLVRDCLASKKVTRDDEDAHDSLAREAQVLYGRVRSIVGTMVKERAGMRWDTFQDILGTHSISSFINDEFAVGLYFESLKAARSGVAQAIGRVEELQRRGQLALTPEVVSRYQGLIKVLERMRGVVTTLLRWVTSPFRLLDPILHTAERSTGIRLLILIGEVAGGVTVVAVVVALAVTAVR